MTVRLPGIRAFVTGSKMIMCSVSLKLETFPCASIPREKYRVPARWRDLREMRANVNVLLLISAERNSAKPFMMGKINPLN